MIMNDWNGNVISDGVDSFYVHDRHGNRWHITDRDAGNGLEIMLTETSTRAMSSMHVEPRSGNVVRLMPKEASS